MKFGKYPDSDWLEMEILILLRSQKCSQHEKDIPAEQAKKNKQAWFQT